MQEPMLHRKESSDTDAIHPPDPWQWPWILKIPIGIVAQYTYCWHMNNWGPLLITWYPCSMRMNTWALCKVLSRSPLSCPWFFQHLGSASWQKPQKRKNTSGQFWDKQPKSFFARFSRIGFCPSCSKLKLHCCTWYCTVVNALIVDYSLRPKIVVQLIK